VRLLVLFLATTIVALAAVGALDWWVDPFGEFWKPGAVQAAEQARPQCLVSRDLFRNTPLRFKLGLAESRRSRTIVLGTSRVTTIPARSGESTFSNLGVLAGHLEDARWLLDHLPAKPPLTVYLGVEVYWFNPNEGRHDFDPDLYDRARYLLSWTTLSATVKLLRREPGALVHRWEVGGNGSRCVVGHGEPADAWNPDGTFVWRFELDPSTPHVPVVSVDELESSFFAGYSGFSSRELTALGDFLADARRRGWRVVGFATPFPTAYVRAFEAAPGIGEAWKEFGRELPRVFRRYGYPWLDLRDVRSIPCAQSDFVDGGFHANARCARRIRARLDKAAARAGIGS
jgi:hypothetical protein